MAIAQSSAAIAGDVTARLGFEEVACASDELASGRAAGNVRDTFGFVACGVRQGQTVETDLLSLAEILEAHAYERVLDWGVQRIEHPTLGLDIHYAAFERVDSTDPESRGAMAMVALPWFEDRTLVVLAIGVSQ